MYVKCAEYICGLHSGQLPKWTQTGPAEAESAAGSVVSMFSDLGLVNSGSGALPGLFHFHS